MACGAEALSLGEAAAGLEGVGADSTVVATAATLAPWLRPIASATPMPRTATLPPAMINGASPRLRTVGSITSAAVCAKAVLRALATDSVSSAGDDGTAEGRFAIDGDGARRSEESIACGAAIARVCAVSGANIDSSMENP